MFSDSCGMDVISVGCDLVSDWQNLASLSRGQDTNRKIRTCRRISDDRVVSGRYHSTIHGPQTLIEEGVRGGISTLC